MLKRKSVSKSAKQDRGGSSIAHPTRQTLSYAKTKLYPSIVPNIVRTTPEYRYGGIAHLIPCIRESVMTYAQTSLALATLCVIGYFSLCIVAGAHNALYFTISNDWFIANEASFRLSILLSHERSALSASLTHILPNAKTFPKENSADLLRQLYRCRVKNVRTA